jgi:ABC-type uncharacterized transport system permease subunit
MLGRLAANLRDRRGVLGTGLEGIGATGEHATVVLDDNCSVCMPWLCWFFNAVLTGFQVM